MLPTEVAYRKPGMHVALEVAAALIGLAAAYLVFGRFRASRRLDHLLLATGLGVLAVANLLFGALPAALGGDPEHRFWTWSALLGRQIGTLLFAAAALVPPRRMTRAHRDAVRFVIAVGAVFAGALVVLAAFDDRLPVAVHAELASGIARDFRLEGHPVVLTLQLVIMIAFAAAAVGFTRRAAALDDDLMRWLAVGAVFAAFARLNYFIVPSIYTEWVYTGDGFRLLFYLAIVVGLAREVRRYWAGLAETAVLGERRRIARDLHDGVAQELAFIARKSRRLAAAGAAPDAEQIAASADRALTDSRRAIAALTRPIDEPLDVVLVQAVEEVASRTDTAVDFDLEPDVRVDPHVREELVRIACEAVANAARHSHAERVRVELERDGALRLRVVDDGQGFNPERPPARNGAGFGLTSMRERAEALGAAFRLRSAPGEGTRVEVEVP